MNADPKTVLCFGDSLTWGYDPRSGEQRLRYPFAERWTRRLQADLGEAWYVIEDGVGGRTTVFDDPVMGEAVNGLKHLPAALQAHCPLDLVVILLGTNDAKTFFGVNSKVIARCLGRLLEVVAKSDCGLDGAPPKMLVVVPPMMGEVTGPLLGPLFDPVHSGAAIAGLPESYPAIAAAYGAQLLDLNSVVGVGKTDGIHFDPESLQPVAQAIAAAVRSAT